jgi:predicted secreted hydrolase
MSEEINLQAKITNAHGVSIEWLRIPVGGQVSKHLLNEKQVIIVKKSEVEIQLEAADGNYVTSIAGNEAGWDSFSIPPKCWRIFKNLGSEEALIAVLISGDQRKSITWSDDVVRKANDLGITKDANGYVAEKKFVERAQ